MVVLVPVNRELNRWSLLKEAGPLHETHRSIQSGGLQSHKVTEQKKKACFIGNVDTEGR